MAAAQKASQSAPNQGADAREVTSGPATVTATNSFYDMVRLLGDLLSSMNRLIPGIAVVMCLLCAGVVYAVVQSVAGMMAAAILIVLVGSLLVYARSRNYGESTLALVVGLLTVFTVSWTKSIFIAFACAWIFFSLMGFLISGVRIAAENDQVYTEAAAMISKGGPEHESLKKELIHTGRRRPGTTGLLTHAQRAVAVREFMRRRTPLDQLEAGLESVNILYTVTRADPVVIADFVHDLGLMVQDSDEKHRSDLIGVALDGLGESGVLPEVFFQAFDSSRRLVLSGDMQAEPYLRALCRGLSVGVPAADMYSYVLASA